MLPVGVSAQTKLPREVKVFKPAILSRDIVREAVVEDVQHEPYGQGDRNAGGSYWVAFSDRDNNVTFDAPANGKPFGKLSFGEKVWIADIVNECAMLFEEVKFDCPKISSGAKFRGWIPISQLLLWEKCLSDNIGISKKAVVCIDLDKTGKEKKDIKRMIYDSPDGKVGSPLATDMHFYYVLKRQDNRVLLGYDAEIHAAGDLYGWVDDTSFVPWNSRTCLEPTWEVEDVKLFASKYAEWKVYHTRDCSGRPMIRDVFRLDVNGKSADFIDERYRNYPPTYLRFPILEGGDDMTYHCTSFGTLNPSGKQSFSETATKYDATKRDAQQRLAQRSIVNIAIVIDGTSSMKQYFDAVKKALAEVEKFFPDDKVNVGVLIYRDKEDGEFVSECFPSQGGFTQPRNQNLRKWLDTGGRYGIKSIAKGDEESVYYGLNTALDQFFPASKDMKGQSNIMLIIGDCGDNGKYKISNSTLVDKFAAQNVSIMGFQVTNRNKSAYQNFNDEIKYLIRASVQKRYENMTSQQVKIYLEKEENGYTLLNEDKEGRNFYIGKLRFNPKMNEPMRVDDLTSGIEEVLSAWKSSVQQLNTMADNYIQTGSPVSMVRDNAVGTQLDRDAVIAIIGKENYEALKDQNALTSFRGYAPKRYGKHPYFKVVVFFPASELKNLVRDLDKVYQASKGDRADRKPYYDAMMNLARSAVAQNQIRSTSYYEILAKVFGIADYKPKSGYTLDDIVDPGVVSTVEYRKIVSGMSSSIDRLKSVLQKNYPFLMETHGTKDKYYWLPSEYLPLPL